MTGGTNTNNMGSQADGSAGSGKKPEKRKLREGIIRFPAGPRRGGQRPGQYRITLRTPCGSGSFIQSIFHASQSLSSSMT